MLIVCPNFLDASEKASTIVCISLTSSQVVLVFSVKCATLISALSGLYVDAIPMSLKAWSSIADSKKEKSVGDSTPPCLTPFVALKESQTSPPRQTLAIIPVCRDSIIVVNFSGHPYLLSSCHSMILPTVSKAFVKSTNAVVGHALFL